MKVLHYISTIDTAAGITSKYMSALCSMSGCHAEIHIVCASSPQPISINNTTVHFIPKSNRNNVRLRSIWLKTLYDIMPDIIHVHGCWSYDLACVVCLSTKHGFRTVLSPQGGLEPWIFKQRLWKEKIPKTVFYQWGAIRKAFAIHVSGAIEYKNFKSLRWNKRIAIVKNSLVTSEIDDEKMASDMLNLYRKILDTDVFRLMDKTTHEVFSKILHAGISGKRSDTILEIDEKGWRQLMIFSKTENIYNIFLKGCSVQQIDLPDIDVNKIETFVTRKNEIDKYEMNVSLTNEQNIVELVKKVRKETFRQEIKLATLCQLSLILRNTEYDEDLLRGALKAKGLIKFMGRIEQIQNELMGLEEGFMPVESVNDIRTSRIKKIITRNLTI